jgi:glycosyltransferase involved in cell wall biosynthesis
MKIAQVVCVYPPYAGGIGTSAQKLQKILSDQHEAFVFTPTDNNRNNDNSENNIIPLKPSLRLGHGAILGSLFKKLKAFDLIYFHYPFFGTGIIIWLFKVFNPQKKLIIQYHMDVQQKNIIYKILSWPEEIIKKSLFKKADLIITASLDYIRHSKIKNIYQKYPIKFKEIPFSVDTDKFKPNTNQIIKDNIILFVGGLDKAHYFKGVDVLIHAVSLIKNNDYILKIAGTGQLATNYKQLAQELKIDNRIIFLGKLSENELIKNYQTAKVLVLPSINSNEAFGIVLIEAMACGTPVIASNLPGVRSVFEDNLSGFKVETKNIIDLKNKLEIILTDDTSIKMGQKAEQLVKEKYSDTVVSSEILTLINSL